MKNIDITSLPAEYKKAVDTKLQGELCEISYNATNFINSQRQLVTNKCISKIEAGREIAVDSPITKKCYVYLPNGYKEDGNETSYNVLYLLHGVGGNRDEWIYGSGKDNERSVICTIFDNLILNGEIEPLIVVFPEGRSAWDWEDRSFNADGTNMLGFYYFDYELRYDLIPFIETNYRTHANINNTSAEAIDFNRLHRALAGLSMGGMQSLNLGLGGYRCDSVKYIDNKSQYDNGLDITVLAPGMEDLFAYIGAFSNAPTSSYGDILGSSVVSRGYNMQLLYMTCGDADEIAYPMGYQRAIKDLDKVAGDKLLNYYQVIIRNAIHDFNVWNNGAYNFTRLCFRKVEQSGNPVRYSLTMDL